MRRSLRTTSIAGDDRERVLRSAAKVHETTLTMTHCWRSWVSRRLRPMQERAGVRGDTHSCERLPEEGLCHERWMARALGEELHLSDLAAGGPRRG